MREPTLAAHTEWKRLFLSCHRDQYAGKNIRFAALRSLAKPLRDRQRPGALPQRDFGDAPPVN